MRAVYAIIALGVLAACDPAIPDSGAGNGFDNSLRAQRARDAELETGTTINGDPLVPPSVVSQETIPAAHPISATAIPNAPMQTVASTAMAQQPAAVAARPLPSGLGSSVDAADIAAEAAAAINASSSNSGQAPLQASPSNPAPARRSSAGISDENNFGRVSEQRSIAADAQQIASNRQQRQIIQPTALPTRSGSSQPNVVAYALKTSNPRGVRIYSRTGIGLAGKSKRNCAKFAAPDQAQQAFLANGGPRRDRKALDPDGDGYACGWDPAPFRQAVQN